MSFLDKTGLARLWANISALADTKVDKVDGKGLSTNDFTDAYKDKVDNDPKFSASAAAGIKTSDITNWNNKSNFSGNYNDLSGKPTIPTVNNTTLTIQKNGTTVKTFTANSASNVTANITVPTKTSDLTNDSGYITANDIPESGGGTDIDYGSSLPTNGSEGDIFLLTDTAGQTFTETISLSITGPTDTTIKLAHKIRSIVSTVESDQHNYVTYNITSSGMLHVVGDVYDPMDVTITYVSNGDWVVPQISDTVNVNATSYGYNISDAILKATDSGNCITVLIDYSLASSGEESWTFQASNGENKTFLAAYALSGNGLVGCSDGDHFGISLNNLSLYFVEGVPRFSGSKAALVIYYA